MKRLLPIFLTAFLYFQLSAQNDLVVDLNPYTETFIVDLNNKYAQGVSQGIFVNNSNKQMRVKWDLVLSDSNCPKSWQYQICDKNNCYVYGILSNQGNSVNTPVLLEPGDTSVLELHVKPNGLSGCCKPTVQLSQFNAPSNTMSKAEFDICIENSTAVTEKQKANLRVYPNPTPNYISLSDNYFVKKIWISNILGKRVRTFQTSQENNYDISSLPDGIYLVSMVDEKNKVLKTVRISKRSIRP